THSLFTLLQQTSHEGQRQFQIPGAQGIAQFENYSGTREGNQLTNKLNTHGAIFPEERVNLFQLVIDLSRIASGQQNEQFKRSLIEFQFSLFCTAQNNFSCLFLPAGPPRIEPVENLKLCAFYQRLVERTPFVPFCGAD